MITKTVSQNLRYGFVFIIYLYFVLHLTEPPPQTKGGYVGCRAALISAIRVL